MKKLMLTLSCVAIALYAYPQWIQTNGPTGGNTSEILKLSQYLFVNGDAAGIFRSSDNGISWETVNYGLPNYPHCTALTSSDTLLYAAVSGNGVYYSPDYGESWVSIREGLGSATLYDLLANGNDLWAAYSQGDLYYSSNHGSTWAPLDGPLPPQQVSRIVISNGTIIAASSGQVFTSNDKGQNWHPVDPGVSYPTNIEAFGNMIYATDDASNTLDMSGDNGATWTEATPVAHFSEDIFLHAIYAREDSIYLGGGRGKVFVSGDIGTTWTKRESSEIFSLHNDILKNNNSLFLSTSDGIYHSADDGQTWSPRNTGIINSIIEYMVPSGDGIIAGGFSGFYESADDGETWAKEKPLNEVIPYVKGVHAYENIRVMATPRTIYRSVDHGPWHAKLLIGDYNISAMIGHKNELIAAVHGVGLYVSDDNGDTWDFVTGDLITQADIRSGYISGDTLMVGGNTMLLISDDRGGTWRSSPLATYFDPSDYEFHGSTLYVASTNNLYSSSDLGLTWERKSTSRSSNIRSLHILRDTVFMASTDGTIGTLILSYDSGDTWHDVGAGLPMLWSSAVTDTHVFGGTYGTGVWRMELEHLNATPVIAGLEEEITIRQGESIMLTPGLFDITDPETDPLTILVLEGENFSVTEGNTLIADPAFTGTLTVNVRVSDGHTESQSFEIAIEVTENMKPEIAGPTQEFVIEKNTSITLSLENIEVSDPDDTEITLEILPGDHYTFSGNEIIPETDFVGDLTVGVVANDAFQDSEIFNVTIKVVELITALGETTPQNLTIYPVPVVRILFIDARDIHEDRFVIQDALGREIVSESLTPRSINEINLEQVPSGLYFLKVRGQNSVRFGKM